MATEGYAVKKGSIGDAEILHFRQAIEEKIRLRVREWVEVVLDEELELALGAGRHERTGQRQGYRNGSVVRRVTLEQGTRELRIPRGRLVTEDDGSEEFRSELLPRYQRRTKVVDDAIVAAYLSGANTRRIRKALNPCWAKRTYRRAP
jgi:transposase-like protein